MVNPKKTEGWGGGGGNRGPLDYFRDNYFYARFHDFLLWSIAHLLNIRHTATKLHNIFYMHVGSKIAQFRDLCTNPMETESVFS